MKITKNCSVCNEPICGHDPYLEIITTGKVYHTCKNEPTCYQVWLQDTFKESEHEKHDM